MKFERSKKWWLKRADAEGDCPIGAGSLAARDGEIMDQIPRRIRLDKMTPTELAITQAMNFVEGQTVPIFSAVTRASGRL